MLMNNLDPEVAERPDDLVVYGGTGKAARNWECFHAIIHALKGLENDETFQVLRVDEDREIVEIGRPGISATSYVLVKKVIQQFLHAHRSGLDNSCDSMDLRIGT